MASLLRAARGERKRSSRAFKDSLSSCKLIELDLPIFDHVVHKLVIVNACLSEPLSTVFHICLQNPVSPIAETDIQPHIVQLAKTGCVDGKGDAFVWNIVKTNRGTL